MLQRSRSKAALVVLALLTTACSGDGDDTDDAALATTTVGGKSDAPDLPAATPPTTPAPASTEPAATVADGEIGGPGAGEDALYPELGTAALDVQHYDLRVAYDAEAQTLDGQVTIETALTTAVDELVLDANGIDVAIVALDGEDVGFEMMGEDLVIPLDSPLGPLGAQEPLTIEVAYQDRATDLDSASGLPVGWFATEGGSFVLNEPDGASTWLPSNDHPADKATWRFELTVPPGVTAVANGELIGRVDADEATTWVWDQREPMATYQMLVLTGDYEVLDGGTYGGVAGPVPLTNVALAEDVARMQPYFDLTEEQLAFFEPLFGPYPLDRYGLAFADSFPGLAMETQGRSLFARDDFPGGEPDYGAHLLTSHELAHQWFGDAVSPADWRDLWLNEAFATYGEWLWLDHAGQDGLQRLAEDSLRQRQRPTEPTGSPSVENLFGYERYGGGAVVVHALRAEIGDEVFFALLQRWVADNDGASRTTEDFIALAEEVAGTDLDAFFEAWLYAPSVPAAYP